VQQIRWGQLVHVWIHLLKYKKIINKIIKIKH
jgi:hypothetical protein